MTELLDGLLQASVWLSLATLVLAAARPLVLRLGGAALAYRSWWLLPLMLVAPDLPLPRLPMTDTDPVMVMASALRAPADAGQWRSRPAGAGRPVAAAHRGEPGLRAAIQPGRAGADPAP